MEKAVEKKKSDKRGSQWQGGECSVTWGVQWTWGVAGGAVLCLSLHLCRCCLHHLKCSSLVRCGLYFQGSSDIFGTHVRAEVVMPHT